MIYKDNGRKCPGVKQKKKFSHKFPNVTNMYINEPTHKEFRQDFS